MFSANLKKKMKEKILPRARWRPKVGVSETYISYLIPAKRGRA